MTSFYKAFEDRFRGSRALISERLKVYLPLIDPLKKVYPQARVVDLGCGRGEWLELVGANGFSAHGVDIDKGMLAEAESLGLSTELQDALEYLKTLADNSVSIVSGFHIAEHLQFDVLQELVQESLRVLKPAGILILETPNPENISVGSNSFYIDPTHVRPLPPVLLSFLPEFYGFLRVAIFRLNSSVAEHGNISLLNVIADASPDYSVVAQKNGDANIVELFDLEFNKTHGVALNDLALRYEQTSFVHNEREKLLCQQVEREQEVGRQISAALLQAAKDSTTQSLRHEDREAALLRESADQEIAHARRLQADKEEFDRVKDAHRQSELQLVEQLNAKQQQAEDLLRAQAEREREFATQLTQLQQVAALDRASLLLAHQEQQEKLRLEVVEHVQAHAQRLQIEVQERSRNQRLYEDNHRRLIEQASVAQQQRENLLRAQTEREREFAAQLLGFQQEAAREALRLKSRHETEINTLASQCATQAQALEEALQLAHAQLSTLQLDKATVTQNLEDERLSFQHLLSTQKQSYATENADLKHELERNAVLARQREQAQKQESERNETSLLLRLTQSEQLRIRQADVRDALESGFSAERHSYVEELKRLNSIAARQHSALTRRDKSFWKRNFSPLNTVRQAAWTDYCPPSSTDAAGIEILNLERTPIMSLVNRIAYQPTFQVKPEGVYELDDFQLLYDSAFVTAAFRAILRRDPDVQGEAYYLERVRKGMSKHRILAQIKKSPEASKYQTYINGLKAANLLEDICSVPVLGNFLLAMVFLWNIKDHLKDLRALENHMVRTAEETHAAHQGDIARLRTELVNKK
jgi:SAM-dependent methyltransferase